MDRIARIIELEGTAAKPERIASEVRWRIARLYWEEHASGTSQTEIAERVGKSRPHVSYMVKCWEVCGRLFKGPLAKFPDFQTIYRSAEVRGASAENGTHERGGDGSRRQRQPDDIHAKVAKFGYLAGDIAGSIAATSGQERNALRHAIRSLERALAAGRPRRAA
jgi:hypothetical protein